MFARVPALAAGAAVCIPLLLVASADAKRLPDTHALEKAAAVHEPTVQRGKVHVSLETGAVVAMGNLRYAVDAGTPEQMARQFLVEHASALGLRDAQASDLRLHAVRRGLSGTTVRFHQVVGDLPVYRGELAVTYNHEGEVRTVASSYRTRAEMPTSAQSISVAEAESIALTYLGVGLDLGFEARLSVDVKTSSVIDVLDGRSHLVHQVDFDGFGPLHGWRVMVDSAGGQVLRAVDTNHYATGSGRAFLPDPLSSATVAYGAPGFSDNSDQDSPEMTAESPFVDLLDITEDSGTFSLVGPWAEQLDWDSPFNGDFSQNSSTWDFTRQADAFEAVNVYYHIDAYMRYLNVTLGLDIRPYQYATGVRYDPSGFSGADNSSYSTGTGRLRFGEGGVDDAEDADVVIHELGHGLHDWVTSGGLSQNQGLSEGVGDYAAVAYSRGFPGQWTDSDPAYNWTFSWDGHNPFWGGRVTNWNDTRTYPDDLTGSIHTDGQFWASCNIDIYEIIGATNTDTAHWEGLARTGGSTNLEQAAQAVLDAAVDLGLPGGDLQTMFDVYSGCGFSVTADLANIFADGFESGDVTAWTSSTP